MAEKTVKTHVGHVLAKLELSDRTQAALYAVREGLGGLKQLDAVAGGERHDLGGVGARGPPRRG